MANKLQSYTLEDMALEIAQIERTPFGAQAIFRASRDNVPYGFGQDGRYEWERVRFVGKIPRDIPADIFRTIGLVGKPGADFIAGAVANTTTVARPNSGAVTAPIDGYPEVFSQDTTFANITTGITSGGAHNTTAVVGRVLLNASATANQFAGMFRGMIGFNVSSIDDTDDITSATLQLYGSLSTTGLGTIEVGIVSANPASPSTLANGDFDPARYGSVEFATRISNTGWSTAGYNNFALNASGLSHISKTTHTFFGTRMGWELDGAFGGAWVSGATSQLQWHSGDNATGDSRDPVLTVEHSASGGGSSSTRFATVVAVIQPTVRGTIR